MDCKPRQRISIEQTHVHKVPIERSWHGTILVPSSAYLRKLRRNGLHVQKSSRQTLWGRSSAKDTREVGFFELRRNGNSTRLTRVTEVRGFMSGRPPRAMICWWCRVPSKSLDGKDQRSPQCDGLEGKSSLSDKVIQEFTLVSNDDAGLGRPAPSAGKGWGSFQTDPARVSHQRMTGTTYRESPGCGGTASACFF